MSVNPMKKRILLVEDETSIIDLLTLVLTKEGYEVHSCQSGRDAISRIKELRPHLIILDVMLPGMDGMGIANILSQDEELSSIPIIVTSALLESEKMFQKFPQVKDFSSKPFALKDLIVKIKQILGDL